MEYLDDFEPIKDKHQNTSHSLGSMDISEQERTFDGFIKWSVRITYVIIGILIFLALWAS